MRIVNTVAKIDLGLCTGCGICELVCPVLAIEMVNRTPQRSDEKCMGCGLCESMCPVFAITMVPRREQRIVRVNPQEVDQGKLVEMCLNAKLHPRQIICFCTRTRAEEVAAAILKGAKSPEEVSLMTGVRTGCKVECIQPIFRLLEVAGITPKPLKGWQWYGKTSTLWEIPEEVKSKYSKRGFYFDDDIRLIEKALKKSEYARVYMGRVNMVKAVIPPLPLRKSIYGDKKTDKKRASELPGMVSVRIKDLFPDMSDPIYSSKEDVIRVRKATEAALSDVDMSMIKPGDTVNVLGSHHGFTILGGEPYAEMLRTIKDVIEQKTGTNQIRLRVGVGLRFREADEYIKLFKLDEYFGRKAIGIAPVDAGFPVETVIGTLYCLKKVYDADWIIHAHNTDVREVHFHRMVDRMVKAFAMSYARIETRSAYHQNLGPRGANFVARAIFDSPFVQKKYTFSCFLRASPTGILGVYAGNDLYELDKRIMIENLRYYGKVMMLLGQVDKCIVVLDFSSPIPYNFAGGTIFANIVSMHLDLFDLEKVPLPPYTFYTEAYYDENARPLIPDIPPVNPGIKMVVMNHSFIGYPSVFFAEHLPIIVVGRSQADLFRSDPQNIEFVKHVVIAEDLDTAMEFAYKVAKTDKVIIFDGAAGGINVSESLAKELEEKAPNISKKVDENLLPKWLRQRGLTEEG